MAKHDNFGFFVPIEPVISKSEKNGQAEMRIRGYASTPDKDRENDILLQEGLDIQDFLDFGWFNYDHQSDEILGYPDADKTYIDENGFRVEGVLLNDVPRARDLWNIALSLQKNGAPRRLGFSVEGRTLKKDDQDRIVKAKVYNVAITPNPVNPKATWEAVVKSFRTQINKALTAGYEVHAGDSCGGECLKNESLEQAFKVIAKALSGDEEALKTFKWIKERMSMEKSVDRDELVLYYQLTKGLSRRESAALVEEVITKIGEDIF